ncbi:MAG: hypothetical protein AABW48_01710 [Nanoarchaeota archaeon]
MNLTLKNYFNKKQLGLIVISCLVFVLISSTLVSAATLKGSVYNSNLDLETDVLVEVNSIPPQKYLAKEGDFIFELAPGKYFLTAKKDQYYIKEEVEIVSEQGEFVFDLFLIPDFVEEDELWQESEEELEVDYVPSTKTWTYVVAALIVVYALIRIYKARKKYGPLNLFRKRIGAEAKKTMEEHKQDLAKEPGYLDQAIEILKKHDGRITQKELRKEMLYLSEGKISLIITELEHKGKVEKVKKGRGNVIILKNP